MTKDHVHMPHRNERMTTRSVTKRIHMRQKISDNIDAALDSESYLRRLESTRPYTVRTKNVHYQVQNSNYKKRVFGRVHGLIFAPFQYSYSSIGELIRDGAIKKWLPNLTCRSENANKLDTVVNDVLLETEAADEFQKVEIILKGILEILNMKDQPTSAIILCSTKEGHATVINMLKDTKTDIWYVDFFDPHGAASNFDNDTWNLIYVQIQILWNSGHKIINIENTVANQIESLESDYPDLLTQSAMNMIGEFGMCVSWVNAYIQLLFLNFACSTDPVTALKETKNFFQSLGGKSNDFIEEFIFETESSRQNWMFRDLETLWAILPLPEDSYTRRQRIQHVVVKHVDNVRASRQNQTNIEGLNELLKLLPHTGQIPENMENLNLINPKDFWAMIFLMIGAKLRMII